MVKMVKGYMHVKKNALKEVRPCPIEDLEVANPALHSPVAASSRKEHVVFCSASMQRCRVMIPIRWSFSGINCDYKPPQIVVISSHDTICQPNIPHTADQWPSL